MQRACGLGPHIEFLTMVKVIFIELDFVRGFQKYIILGVLSEKLLSGTSPYLEDILHLPVVPDGYHDVWGHLH